MKTLLKVAATETIKHTLTGAAKGGAGGAATGAAGSYVMSQAMDYHTKGKDHMKLDTPQHRLNAKIGGTAGGILGGVRGGLQGFSRGRKIDKMKPKEKQQRLQ